MSRIYILYDERAAAIDPSDCVIFTVSNSMREAKEDREITGFENGVIYSYAVKDDVLTDKRCEG